MMNTLLDLKLTLRLKKQKRIGLKFIIITKVFINIFENFLINILTFLQQQKKLHFHKHIFRNRYANYMLEIFKKHQKY